jgi:hypothetical protein
MPWQPQQAAAHRLFVGALSPTERRFQFELMMT